MEDKHLLQCPRCGAFMIQEGYLQYGWYLDGRRIEGCPAEAPTGRREDKASVRIVLLPRRRTAASTTRVRHRGRGITSPR